MRVLKKGARVGAGVASFVGNTALAFAEEGGEGGASRSKGDMPPKPCLYRLRDWMRALRERRKAGDAKKVNGHMSHKAAAAAAAAFAEQLKQGCDAQQERRNSCGPGQRRLTRQATQRMQRTSLAAAAEAAAAAATSSGADEKGASQLAAAVAKAAAANAKAARQAKAEARAVGKDGNPKVRGRWAALHAASFLRVAKRRGEGGGALPERAGVELRQFGHGLGQHAADIQAAIAALEASGAANVTGQVRSVESFFDESMHGASAHAGQSFKRKSSKGGGNPASPQKAAGGKSSPLKKGLAGGLSNANGEVDLRQEQVVNRSLGMELRELTAERAELQEELRVLPKAHHGSQHDAPAPDPR